MKLKSLRQCCGLIGLGLTTAVHSEVFMDGDGSIEQRLFLERPAPPTQLIDPKYPYPVYHQISAALSPHIYLSPARSGFEYTVHPFIRIDERDQERAHADFRELKVDYVTTEWAVTAGFDQIYWGVMENHHLIDIINQTDYNESPNGEDKLGQPLLGLSLFLDNAMLEMLILLGYREPAVPTAGARLSYPPDADYVYEGWWNELHPDFALRYEKQLKNIDLGISYFGGHSRTPELRTDTNGSQFWYVDLVNQTALDVKANLGKLDLMAEIYYRSMGEYSARASVLGAEYRLLALTPASFSILSEYSWDQRGQLAFDNTFQNDLFVGARVLINALRDSEILLGHSYDLDFNSQYGFLDANINVTDKISVGFEAWWFDIDSNDYANRAFNNDNFLQLTLAYNF